MWNFKGHLWNFTQNFGPTHRMICILPSSVFACVLRYISLRWRAPKTATSATPFAAVTWPRSRINTSGPDPLGGPGCKPGQQAVIAVDPSFKSLGIDSRNVNCDVISVNETDLRVVNKLCCVWNICLFLLNLNGRCWNQAWRAFQSIIFSF